MSHPHKPGGHQLITVPFDTSRTLIAQVTEIAGTVAPRRCHKHPDELMSFDLAATLESIMRTDTGIERYKRGVLFRSIYARCGQCPHNTTPRDSSIDGCPIVYAEFFKPEFSIRDEKRILLPHRDDYVALKANESIQDQHRAWMAREPEFRCTLGNELLRRTETTITLPFQTLAVQPQFVHCPQCHLERLGIDPDDAHASFENFVVNPADIRSHLEACQAYAANPMGVLLLLGNTGTGKTHLAVAIMRELVKQGARDLVFVKHRHFLNAYRQAQRPVSFGTAPAPNPLSACQQSALLVYDEMTESMENAVAAEDLFLDLFETRIGNLRHSIITAKMNPRKLESVLGTRLYDRLRRVSTVLEFGFPSKRQELKPIYVNRIQTRGAV